MISRTFSFVLLASLTALPVLSRADDGPKGLSLASRSDTQGLVRVLSPRLGQNRGQILLASSQDRAQLERSRILAGKPLLREDDLGRRSAQEYCLLQGFTWAASWRVEEVNIPEGWYAAHMSDLLPEALAIVRFRESDPMDRVGERFVHPSWFKSGGLLMTQVVCTSNRELVGSKLAWQFLDGKDPYWDTAKLKKKFGYIPGVSATAAQAGTSSIRNFQPRCWSGVCEGDNVWLPYEDHLYGDGVVDRIDFDKEQADVLFIKKPGQVISVPVSKLEKK